MIPGLWYSILPNTTLGIHYCFSVNEISFLRKINYFHFRMENNELQLEFFNYLKSTLPAHVSLADELCDLLNISADSAYRRLRGEKSLAFSELKIICEKFHVSLDQVLNLQNDTVAFRAPDLIANHATFADHMRNILKGVMYFHQFKERKMMYLCKDAPFWYFYVYPELAAFKTFFFLRSLRNESSVLNKKFSLKEFPFDDCFAIGQQMLKAFNEIHCEELWNNESWNSTINQVAYYREAGIFGSTEDYERVVDSILKTIDHLELQATAGQKFMSGDSDLKYRAPIQFYVNDLIIGNNTIYGDVGGNKISWVTYSVLNTLVTQDKRFNDHLFQNFYTLRSRSTLVSGTGERERVRFFNSLRDKVNTLRK